VSFGEAGNATLGEIIAHLETLPLDMVAEDGFGNPHSYRGHYEDLAFEPAAGVTVGSMLAAARGALGRTFSGYKGGDYVMRSFARCWLAPYGACGIPIVLPEGEPPVYVLPAPPSPEKEVP
jgi:hypothetical protein